MAEDLPKYDEEIDFITLFQILWDGKWLICSSIIIAVLLGGGSLLVQSPEYESKLSYSIDTIPPFYSGKKASNDFQKKFYSANVFGNWKNHSGTTFLSFEDFSATEIVNGYVFSRSEDKQLATLKESFVLVKTSQLRILDEVFKYANHVNKELKIEYVARANEELEIIESRFGDLRSADSNTVNTVLSIDKYIVTAGKGANVLNIQHPTIPVKVSPKFSLTLALSVVLGGMVGVFFILLRRALTGIRTAFKKRNEQLRKG